MPGVPGTIALQFDRLSDDHDVVFDWRGFFGAWRAATQHRHQHLPLHLQDAFHGHHVVVQVAHDP
jgi:hypothetical protein